MRLLAYIPNTPHAWALSNRRRDRMALVRLDMRSGNEDLVHDIRWSTSEA